MSKETQKWLNTMTLIGNVLKRGRAWHWREAEQGDEPNHYDGFIPMDDVRRRLFDWTAEETPVFIKTAQGTFREIEDRKAVIHSTTGKVFNVFSNRYNVHQYEQTLLKNLTEIIDSHDLGIDSAGLLREGGKAWVQISVPENISSKAGFEFRPTLLASTAHDGTLATTYRRVIQAVVCDNTLNMALNEQTDSVVKFRHNSDASLDGSLARIREALEIIYQTAESFQQELDALTAWSVTDKQFTKLVEQVYPISLTDDGSQNAQSASKQNPKRDALQSLWRNDERVTPWKNTALGVVQAFTTANQHVFGKQESRAQRNYNQLVNGAQFREDAIIIERLREITEEEPELAMA
jgi:phage/plasmid-like protein (TIGR03299 family)